MSKKYYERLDKKLKLEAHRYAYREGADGHLEDIPLDPNKYGEPKRDEFGNFPNPVPTSETVFADRDKRHMVKD